MFFLADIMSIVHQLLLDLAPACERIAIAGSLRRGKSEVGDIEIVCAPRLRAVVGLFGDTVGEESELDGALARLVRQGRLEPGDKCGERYKVYHVPPVGIKLDLFVVRPPAEYGVILAIRTGPAEFSKRLVTPRKHGGLLPSHLKVKDGAIWDNGTMIPTPEEIDVFGVLGLPFIEPGARK